MGIPQAMSVATQTDDSIDDRSYQEPQMIDVWIPTMIFWNRAFMREQPEAVNSYLARRLQQVQQQTAAALGFRE